MNAQLREITETEYEKLLDEIYKPFQMGSFVFNAGRILRKLDPVAFQCGMNEEPEQWECNLCNDTYDTEEDAEECCK